MAVGDPIKGVAIGLGKKPNPSAIAFNGTGGMAVVYHDASEYGSLMALWADLGGVVRRLSAGSPLREHG